MQALRANKRIDGLYLYVNTSSPDVLSSRQKQRLAEPDSTLSRRVAWAKQQVTKSQSPGLFDAIVPNTTIDQVNYNADLCVHSSPQVLRKQVTGCRMHIDGQLPVLYRVEAADSCLSCAGVVACGL